jgi:WhiB family redox-sensing transcriptional regulator
MPLPGNARRWWRPGADVTSSETEWQREAACAFHDPELFFPAGTTGPAAAQEEQARQICAACPVRNRCLEWALQAGVDHGIWGGLSEHERQSLRRRRRRSARVPVDPRALPDSPHTASQFRTANAAKAISRLG